jgi:hypothetical protein
MDDETRYWILLKKSQILSISTMLGRSSDAKVIADMRPETLITDGLHAYKDDFNKEFYTNNLPHSQHINAIKLTGKANNNKMERINGEIRDREKTMRGLKIKETSKLKGDAGLS